MTTTSAAPGSQGTVSVTGAGPWRILLAIGSLVGPVLLAVGTALDWTGSGADPLEYLGRLADARSIYLAAGLLMMLGMAFLPLTAVGVFRAAAGRRRATPLRVGGVLVGVWGVFGTAGIGGGYTAGIVSVDLVGTVPDDVVAQVFNAITYGPFTTIGAIVGGAGFFLGTLVTGIGILLARGLPVWSGIVVLTAIPVSLLQGTGIHWLGATAFGLLAVGLAGLIPAMLRYRTASAL
ncbi:hypothetical protein [Propionicimonas sp.]|uniref:hypothetical protein n=1 Tax=Propionicimonas sp. TaxID=1955623 RepID=UPI0039E588C4